MKKLLQGMKRFWKDESGLVAIEYGLMATFVALGIAVGANALGSGLNTMFDNVAACFTKAGGTCPVTLPVTK